MTPDQLLVGYHDYRFVALSVLLAILGAYCTLDLAGWVTAARDKPRLLWLIFGAAAMGVRTWSMDKMPNLYG
jgi:NO-binding membrane sensor protein with MHYT domain